MCGGQQSIDQVHILSVCLSVLGVIHTYVVIIYFFIAFFLSLLIMIMIMIFDSNLYPSFFFSFFPLTFHGEAAKLPQLQCMYV